ncbi:MAG: DUF4886 domain-containing protein [Eubacteriales bacterium]
MKILSIGNSFSRDAQRYLYGIGRSAGVPVKAMNLVIGGCSLYRHYRNMLSEGAAYALDLNGMPSDLPLSLKDALLSDEWHFVTLQQYSFESTDYPTYQPYLNELAAYIRRLCPGARLLLQQTWAYEPGSARLAETRYTDPEKMHADLSAAYRQAAKDIRADGILPVGDAIAEAYKRGLSPLYRDGFHLSLGLGRFLAGCVWFSCLTGQDLSAVSYHDFDRETDPAMVEEAKAIAASVAQNYPIAGVPSR